MKGKCIYNEKLVFWNKCSDWNILLDRNGELNSVAFFYNKGLDYLDVLQIKKIYEALPFGWKTKIDSTELDRDVSGDELTFISNGRTVSLDKISSKDVYRELCKKKSVIGPSVREKLRKLYTRDFSEKRGEIYI